MKKFVLLLLLGLASPAMSELPTIGDTSQTVLTPQQERQIGRQSLMQIRASKEYLSDIEINDYLNQIGRYLVERSSEPSLEFEFFGINENNVNAFALPGGFIGVNAGLILTTQSESELAAVLCHEIAHVTQHHLARLIEAQEKSSVASFAALALAILAARNNPQAAQAAIAGSQAANIQTQLNFTRTHEEEADRVGFDILQKSSFSVHAMPEFLERMQRATRLMDSKAPSYLRTHPITSDRIADTANRVSKHPFRLVADSLTYQFVRTKLIAQQKSAHDAVVFFNDALEKKPFGNPIAQRYGLVWALLRQGQTAQAEQELQPLLKQASGHPMVETLAGKVKQAKGNINESLVFYQQAVKNFPQHRALLYDYIELLLQNKQADEVVKLLGEQLLRYPTDSSLYEFQARAYTLQNKRYEQHYAQANAYAYQGRIHSAIEQLLLAKQLATSFYQQATLDSDLKELKEIIAASNKK